MNKRNASMPWPVLAVLVISMLSLGLACGGEKATPTSPPQATATLAATATLVPGETPVATAVPEATATAVPEVDLESLPWMERYMQGPGYRPEWGEPVTGGIVKFRATTDFNYWNPHHRVSGYSGVYLPIFNALFRINPWVGLNSPMEGDLVESWDMSGDGLTLTMKLREGVYFQDNPNSIVPREYKGGLIKGDEYVCEDAKASTERHVWPPEWESARNRVGAAQYSHLESVTCPDGPRGYTFVMRFKYPLGRTMQTLAAGKNQSHQMDKDFIEWLHNENPGGQDEGTREAFLMMVGTGAFMPLDAEWPSTQKIRRNPNYFREGLPLVDGFDSYVIRDATTAFTSLVTGKITFFGEGSYSFTVGQVEQALRDFRDRIVIEPNLHTWGRAGTFNALSPPTNDARFRRAIHLGIDRQDWLEYRTIRVGGTTMAGENLSYLMFPGSIWAATEEDMRTNWPGLRETGKDADIAEANRLLDELYGVGNRPKGLTCTTREVATIVESCLFVVDQLKKNLNLEVGMDVGPTAAQTEKKETGRFDFDMGSSISTEIGDPDDLLLPFYVREFATAVNAPHLPGLWEEMPETMEWLESTILAQSAEMDPVKRQQMVRDIEWTLINDVNYHLVLGWSNIFPAWRAELKGFHSYDSYSYTKWAVWERVWLAK